MWIQLIKSSDPTFEASLLSRAEAWKVYISSYETIYPTEGVDHAGVQFPFLRRSLKNQFGSEDPSDKLAELSFVDNERMQFRIGASSYRMEVEPYSTDLIDNSVNNPRAVSKADANAETERRSASVEERFSANAEWMKGRSKEEVDTKKQEFMEMFDEKK